MAKGKKSYGSEFTWILIGEVVLLGLIFTSEPSWLGPLSILRVILGLAYTLFIPGYTIQTALFPRDSDLDGTERVMLSFGFSIAIIAPLALLLDRLPWGIQLWPIVIVEGATILLFSLITIWRRWRLASEEGFRPAVRINWHNFWTAQDRTGKILVIVVGITLAITFGLMVSFIVLPSPAETYTEFYMLGREGMAEGYPRQGTAGQPLQVTIGITNFEGIDTDYFVKVYQNDELIGEAGPFRLDDEQTIEAPLTFIPMETGEDVDLMFYLYRSNQPEPYRSLLLRLNIEPTE